MPVSPMIEITYCRLCGWGLRAGWMAQELLTTFAEERTFEPSFQLADHVVVKGARLENGLLHVDLVREIPEAMKPRAIPIASSSKVLEVQPTKAAA